MKFRKKLTRAALRNQLDALNTSGAKYESLLKTIEAKSAVEDGHLKKLNESLIHTERTLTRPEGLPNRDWYKHQIYAPGFYTGYGVKTLPGIREAVELGACREADESRGRVYKGPESGRCSGRERGFGDLEDAFQCLSGGTSINISEVRA